MAVRWTYLTGITDDNNEADSLFARLDVNDAIETTGVVPNDIVVDDAVTDAAAANGTAGNDDAAKKKTSPDDIPANEKNSSREKTRSLKKGRKARY